MKVQVSSKYAVVRVGGHLVKSEMQSAFTCTYQIGSTDYKHYQLVFPIHMEGLSVKVVEIKEFESLISC